MIMYGASGHGKVILEILESNNDTDIRVWDDAAKPDMWEYPVEKPLPPGSVMPGKMVISIGVNATRKRVAERFANTVEFGTAIHADAYISKRATVDEGTVVMAGVRINPDTRVGKHCIVNTCASIDHDCVLADFVHISPNATLSGDVHVGEGTHIGSGASVIQGIRIGKWCTIGAGAAVVRDIPDYSTAVGVPAKVIKTKHV
ncbi:acetyltransferase [Flavipsychrobacter stenotrophus]|uniref:Acetyltransferase n=1 Tax=Flavipsychrobacter stenotrophus TaxID=2077091 RepID=A0A2S7SXT0_9BACT|nr:acetyltransferase [Flavipsychrobacter stenotrophus]PQJ11733.1 acetyltransferase [Flavipsychrobacter stenotrophus]